MLNRCKENRINLDLIRAFMQVDGHVELNTTTNNYDEKGGVKFSGHNEVGDEYMEIVMDRDQVEQINECQSIAEVYACYKEMEYF